VGLRGAPLAAVGVDMVAITWFHRSPAVLPRDGRSRDWRDVQENAEKTPASGEVDNMRTREAHLCDHDSFLL
jgi:hypothetical protein